MGLFTKLRPDDRRKLLPMVPQPYMGHSKTNISVSSAADGSEFLLVASASSHSLADTHKRHSEIPKGMAQTRMTQNHDTKEANRRLVHGYASANVAASSHNLYQQQQHYQQHYQQQYLQNYEKQYQHLNKQLFFNGHSRSLSELQTQYNQNHQGRAPVLPQVPLQSQMQGQNGYQYRSQNQVQNQNYQGYDQSYMSQQPYLFPTQGTQASLRSQSIQRQSQLYQPGPIGPASADTSAEFSEEEYTSESGSEEESESESEPEPSRKHPYYEQWKQYYAAMASYQAINQQRANPNYRHSMYTGNLASNTHSIGSNHQSSDYLAYCNQISQSAAENKFVQHSRRNTLKLNRSSSVPLLVIPKQSQVSGGRAVSVNVTIPDADQIPHSSSMTSMRNVIGSRRASAIAVNTYTRLASEVRIPRTSSGLILSGEANAVSDRYDYQDVHLTETPSEPRSRTSSQTITMPKTRKPLSRQASIARKFSQVRKASSHLMTERMLRIRLNEEGEEEISDYEAFLFEDSEADGTNGDILESDGSPGVTSSQDNTEAQIVPGSNVPEPPVLDSLLITENSTAVSLEKKNPTPVVEPARATSSPKQDIRDMIIQEGPPPQGYSTEASNGLNRQDSSASTSSYNSLQSENNFTVGRIPNRLVTPSTSTSSKRRRPKDTQSFVPPMQGPPPPIFSSAPTLPGHEGRHSPMPTGRDSRRNTLGNLGINESFHIQQMQQQIQQLQQMQQMMPMYGNNTSGVFRSLPPPPAKSSDSTINDKINEFVDLRKIIASGNKSVEYRLKWMKMLVVAIQYKVYAYINIKGDSIAQDQIAENKRFFMKSAVTHLQKLVKELEGPKLPSTYTVLAEACYIYGCLLKHEYVERFEQDFGIPRDDEQATVYLKKCLELNPAFFKAHYLLAEIYEQQETEEAFDRALDHYKESARLGYYRGIYRVALILLMVPKVRNLNYLKYFRSLSDIDMQSKDIQLSGSDRDELEEVVGLALYQLGRIYEGIYPGDLKADDEFVRGSLELAPVNYAKSLSYYNRAAKHHCLLAQVKLGHIYESGDLNRQKNAAKSIQWYIKAATSPLKFKRHPEAMLGISRWFFKGSNGESKHIPVADPQRAVEWCERAFKEFQSPEACHMLGIYGQQGFGLGNAEEWFAEAERLGYQPSLQGDETIGNGNEDSTAETNVVQS
ncbi:CIC11C00000002974 [Sungouiella intermedia]|uniref:CIC11C00000002974 n=1 Tax=Sungouiella intermedia TaxID=45354 RepID=A0A1L0G7F0_9ASCO|nr:CIC11C00000002974 [[Candida] intermedia]